MAAAGPAPSVLVLAVLSSVAGLFIPPTLTSACLLADETAPPERRVQAGVRVNTAVNAGDSGGGAVAGALTDRLPLPTCFALTAVAAAVVALARSSGRRGGAVRAGASSV
ncbi:hypothetical protein SAMN02745673_01930 [Marinactinospora thermotolerans DSM 45154]|uniref:Arabinose efflux permease n=2 Tax=Marinactinospora thermotolerans TaxID=531310 RepID=A0A1T4PPC8_9ACTN|nr:hypothetical protein SAMN02745673_01930 [Marinactinospora thermotolerans DSM 45154]